ncbi:family 10 glycosylhydrolase [Pseudogulbenkiania subflava]|uniref:Glycosyl hydrolase-like 10 n=1 Tax=Pseudogulbenkiania subflava DSM 22618 TaxID=1123014 RepID=A0A1Y6BTL7_9NEIS|nr:family 10 glycosylhydrolase [Pseudogulbenkiania subflava]SMF24645.1 Glycosyl hydrolase-like 10 [Pseudogulbenkiania subflava DSM 22618]
MKDIADGLLRSLLLMAVLSGLTACATQKPYATEVIVRTAENFHSHDDIVHFLQVAASSKVTVVNLNVKNDEDGATISSGYVFYDSKIAPKAAGYHGLDVLQDVIDEAHKRHIQVRAWIPQFHDRAAVERNGVWQMRSLVNGDIVPFQGVGRMEYFVNPLHPDVQAYQRSIIREIVSRYDIDGIVLDWLRFDDFNMDMSDLTRWAYQEKFGVDPIAIDLKTDNDKRKQWGEWRTDQIGDYVKAVRDDIKQIKPGISLGVYILPPEFSEVGQDVAKFKDYLDFVSPMAYFRDWEFKPGWVYDDRGILAQTRRKAVDKTIVPTFDVHWSAEEYREIYAGMRRHHADIDSLAFFAHGKWSDELIKKLKGMQGR